jgi:hypothetical protein
VVVVVAAGDVGGDDAVAAERRVEGAVGRPPRQRDHAAPAGAIDLADAVDAVVAQHVNVEPTLGELARVHRALKCGESVGAESGIQVDGEQAAVFERLDKHRFPSLVEQLERRVDQRVIGRSAVRS